jgi:Xaa-Pro aminopeptidase
LLQRIRRFAHSITCHPVRLAAIVALQTPGQHIFGPPIHGEKEPPPLRANVVIAAGNCGLYLGQFGVRVEDTVLATAEGNSVLTTFPRSLT